MMELPMPAVAITERYVRPIQESLLIYEAQELFGQLVDVYDGPWRVPFLKIERVRTTV